MRLERKERENSPEARKSERNSGIISWPKRDAISVNVLGILRTPLLGLLWEWKAKLGHHAPIHHQEFFKNISKAYNKDVSSPNAK